MGCFAAGSGAKWQRGVIQIFPGIDFAVGTPFVITGQHPERQRGICSRLLGILDIHQHVHSLPLEIASLPLR